jgi:hypothetical protein
MRASLKSFMLIKSMSRHGRQNFPEPIEPATRDISLNPDGRVRQSGPPLL